jgi:hypothetical protein
MALVELRLAERGLTSRSAAVHVPQYLAATPYPTGALALMGQISRVTGLDFDTTRLVEAAVTTDEEIARQVESAPEVREIIGQLEARWDAARRDRALPSEESLPSAEEIAAELEAFLASQTEFGPTLRPPAPGNGSLAPDQDEDPGPPTAAT